MKRLLIALCLLTCCSVVFAAERPVVDIPFELRQENWGTGSCVHATMVSLFRWQGQYKLADYWRRTYSGGEYVHGLNLAAKFEANNVRYAYVTNGDVKFLEWACNTRRGCGITVMGGRHMVALIHLDEEWAVLLDNNFPREYIWMPREELIDIWTNSFGWAVTPVYTPAAPLPST